MGSGGPGRADISVSPQLIRGEDRLV